MNLVESTDRSITRNQAQLSFNGESGALLGDTRNNSAIATLNNGVYGLHMAHFAQPLLRFTLFFSGLLGCAMIASGLLLWSLKRQLQNKKQSLHFGHYMVNRLNTAAIIGLPDCDAQLSLCKPFPSVRSWSTQLRNLRIFSALGYSV